MKYTNIWRRTSANLITFLYWWSLTFQFSMLSSMLFADFYHFFQFLMPSSVLCALWCSFSEVYAAFFILFSFNGRNINRLEFPWLTVKIYWFSAHTRNTCLLIRKVLFSLVLFQPWFQICRIILHSFFLWFCFWYKIIFSASAVNEDL
jgi:hypothetical protein